MELRLGELLYQAPRPRLHARADIASALSKKRHTTAHARAVASGKGELEPDVAEFVAAHTAAVQSYFSGDWPAAKEKYEECLRIRPSDPPAKVMLGVIAETNGGNAPVDWNGSRRL